MCTTCMYIYMVCWEGVADSDIVASGVYVYDVYVYVYGVSEGCGG